MKKLNIQTFLNEERMVKIHKGEKDLFLYSISVLLLEFQKEIGIGQPGVVSTLLQNSINKFEIWDVKFKDKDELLKVLGYLSKVVVPHKIEVYKAGAELAEQSWFKDLNIDKEIFLKNLLIHDFSKFSVNETSGYVGYNFKNPTPESKIAFERSWHHHKMCNEHHPEYWMNPDKSGNLDILPIPMVFVLEMVADWIGAGKTYGSTIEQWLPGNLHDFNWHEETAVLVQQILKNIGINTTKAQNILTCNV